MYSEKTLFESKRKETFQILYRFLDTFVLYMISYDYDLYLNVPRLMFV